MNNLSYKEALAEARKQGAANAQGFALLAQTVSVASIGHAVNPELVYEGAVKLGKSPKEIVRLSVDDPASFGDLMFV